MMNLDNLPTHELAEVARAEAAAFNLPVDWRSNRASSHGLAIDSACSSDIDDAVSLNALDTGYMLHVSIADVGSFLANQVAVARYARRRAWSLYKGNKVIAPMIPRDISENKLSLLDGEERPVVTIHVPISSTGAIDLPQVTQERIHAQRLTYQEVEDLVDEENDEGTALHKLRHVAGLLFAARHNGEIGVEDATPEDEQGNLLDTHGFDTGQLIVQESMIAANAAMAQFMLEHEIPALYRNHVVSSDLFAEFTDTLERSRLLGQFARGAYNPVSQGHAALNLSAYTHFTSPLRRFPDFANHANLIAFLEKRAYPYPADRLGRIAERLQRLALKEIGPRNSDTFTPAGRQRRFEPLIPRYRTVAYLLEKFEDGSAGPGDIATALFNAVGSPQEIMAVKNAAARFAANHIEHARPAFNVALDRGHATLHIEQTESNTQEFVLNDRKGGAYPYPLHKIPLEQAAACARLIGIICKLDIDPVVPERFTRKGRILKDSIRYLRNMADEERIALSIQSCDNDNGLAYGGVAITIHGERHTAFANLASRNAAVRQACAELIQRLDLIDNVPAMPRIPRVRRPKDPNNSPVVFLHARQQIAECPSPEYFFFGPYGNNNGLMTCAARATDIDGQIYVAAAEAIGKSDAKWLAAQALYDKMPARPLNKKGKTHNRLQKQK
jgi:hypothetical protein